MAHNHEVPGSSPGPATKKKGLPKGSPFFLVLAKDENRTAKPRFDNKDLTQVLAPSKRRRYMREGAIVLVPQPRKKDCRTVVLFSWFWPSPGSWTSQRKLAWS